MQRKSRIKILFIVSLVMTLTLFSVSFGKILFEDDFEKDTIGEPPANLEHLGPPNGYAGGGLSVVAEDPLDSNNKVFHLIPKGFDNNSHDIWASHAGDESWINYVWEFDWLFPEETYCPVTFRTQKKDEFCQLSRRPGGSEFHIYARDAQQNWNLITNCTFPNEVSKWYRVRIRVEENNIVFKIKERDEQKPFEEIKEPDVIEEGGSEPFSYGGIGAQEGYTGMIDNVIVGETIEDIMSVEFSGKLATTWGDLKRTEAVLCR